MLGACPGIPRKKEIADESVTYDCRGVGGTCLQSCASRKALRRVEDGNWREAGCERRDGIYAVDCGERRRRWRRKGRRDVRRRDEEDCVQEGRCGDEEREEGTDEAIEKFEVEFCEAAFRCWGER